VVSVVDPSIVEAFVNSNKSLLLLSAKAIGDSQVKVALKDSPQIFDLFFVRVRSIIQPA